MHWPIREDMFSEKHHSFFFVFVLLIAVVLPRLVSLGFYPFMDEAYYSFLARQTFQYLSLGLGLPTLGGVHLYPGILAPFCGLPGITLIWLRIFDLVAALGAGGLLCVILCKESGNKNIGLLLAAIFLFAMNCPDVIQAGAKNSITLATIPLLGAFLLCDAGRLGQSGAWYAVGALVAIGVLLREPFFVFSILGLVAISYSWGWSALWRYAIGGVCTGILVIGLAALGKGGLWPLAASYLDDVDVYANQNAQILSQYVHSLWKAFCAFPEAVLLLLVALRLLFWPAKPAHESGGTGINKRRYYFWTVVTFLPLVEPMVKIGFVYHIAQCLPGAAILCAMAWKNATEHNVCWLQKKFVIPVLTLAAVLAMIRVCDFGKIRMSMDVLHEFPSSETWPVKYERQSNTLIVGKTIRNLLPRGGTVSTGGFTFFIYDVALAMPPFVRREEDNLYRYSDLARSYSFMGKKPENLAKVLCDDSPDVVVVPFTHDIHEDTFYEGVTKAVALTQRYTKMVTVGIDEDKNYGWLGYDIYQRNDR